MKLCVTVRLDCVLKELAETPGNFYWSFSLSASIRNYSVVYDQNKSICMLTHPFEKHKVVSLSNYPQTIN